MRGRPKSAHVASHLIPPLPWADAWTAQIGRVRARPIFPVRSSSSRPAPALSCLSLLLGPTHQLRLPRPLLPPRAAITGARPLRHSAFPGHVSSLECATPLLPSCSALPTPVAHLPTPPLGLVRQQLPPLLDNSGNELLSACPSLTLYKPLPDFFLRTTLLPPPLSRVPHRSRAELSLPEHHRQLWRAFPTASGLPEPPRRHHHTSRAIAVLRRHSSGFDAIGASSPPSTERHRRQPPPLAAELRDRVKTNPRAFLSLSHPSPAATARWSTGDHQVPSAATGRATMSLPVLAWQLRGSPVARHTSTRLLGQRHTSS